MHSFHRTGRWSQQPHVPPNAMHKTFHRQPFCYKTPPMLPSPLEVIRFSHLPISSRLLKRLCIDYNHLGVAFAFLLVVLPLLLTLLLNTSWWSYHKHITPSMAQALSERARLLDTCQLLQMAYRVWDLLLPIIVLYH